MPSSDAIWILGLPGALELATHRESEKLPEMHVGTAHALNSNRIFPTGIFPDPGGDKGRPRLVAAAS